MTNRLRIMQEKIARGVRENPPKDLSSIVDNITTILEDSSLTADQVRARLSREHGIAVVERTVRKARQDRRPALERVYGLNP